MRYSVSLILLLLCTNGLAVVRPNDQKWTVDMGAPVLATPASAPDGTVYAIAGNVLYEISAQGSKSCKHYRTRKLVYDFSIKLDHRSSWKIYPLDTSPVVSPDGRYLYMTFDEEKTTLSRESASYLITFDLAQPGPARQYLRYYPYPSNWPGRFSAPSVDIKGAVYVEYNSTYIRPGLPVLVKISGDKTSPLVTRVIFSKVQVRYSLEQQKLGPPIYNSGEAAGGTAVVGNVGNFPDYPGLFYTSFEEVQSPRPFWHDYHYYDGWGSELQRGDKYSVPVVDNNLDNLMSQGIIYMATNRGDLMAYQGKIDNRYGIARNTWSQHLSNTDLSKSAPVVAKNGTVYIGDAVTGILYAANYEKDARPGIPLSAYGITSRPAVDNKNDLVYVVDKNGGLFAVDARSRTCFWKDENAHAITAPVVGSDGTVVVGTSDNKVTAYQGGRAHTPHPCTP